MNEAHLVESGQAGDFGLIHMRQESTIPLVVHIYVLNQTLDQSCVIKLLLSRIVFWASRSCRSQLTHPIIKSLELMYKIFARNYATQCRYNPSAITQQKFHTMLVLQAMTRDFSFHLQEMREMMQAFNTRLDKLEHKIEQRLAQQDHKIEAIRTEMRATRFTCTLQ